MKRIFAVGAMALLIAGTAQAQGGSGSDHSGPGGAGAGVGGSLGAFLPTPSTGGGGMGGGPTGNNVNGVSTSFQAGGNVTTTVGGATVPVPATAAAQVGGTLSGNATQSAAFVSGLSGTIGSGPATALAQALQALGASPSFLTLVAAVNAYNAAVNALPAGAQPPAQLLAARAALQRLSGR